MSRGGEGKTAAERAVRRGELIQLRAMKKKLDANSGRKVKVLKATR